MTEHKDETFALNVHDTRVVDGKQDVRLLFTIKVDGRIEFGPHFTTNDKMSLKFWEAIANTFPLWLDKLLESRASLSIES